MKENTKLSKFRIHLWYISRRVRLEVTGNAITIKRKATAVLINSMRNNQRLKSKSNVQRAEIKFLRKATDTLNHSTCDV